MPGRWSTQAAAFFEDELRRAEHGVDRLVRGHVVLKPKQHVHELAAFAN